MKILKNTLLLYLLFFASSIAVAQKQSFDVLTYAEPKGWQQKTVEGGLQLSTSDNSSGAYGVIVLTKAIASTASAKENFKSNWEKLIKPSVKVNTEPILNTPIKENGWNIVSGGANYTEGEGTGLVTLLTATGSSQMVSIIVMTNTKQYQKELSDFINSLEIQPASTVNATVATKATPTSSLAGKTWQAYTPEKYPSSYTSTAGYHTGGFWFWQYTFNADGTYRFIYTGASALATNPVNILQYETGTYQVNGNQLTIAPQKGSNEEWSVGNINNGMSETHIRDVLENRVKKLKMQVRKLEKITYSFKIEYWEGNKENALMLHHVQNTVRDGSPGANNYSSYFEGPADKYGRLLPK